MKFLAATCVAALVGVASIATAQPVPGSTDSITCGEFSVRHGGPTNACGGGAVYNPAAMGNSDSTTCYADGGRVNCFDQCCADSDPVVYRRSPGSVPSLGGSKLRYYQPGFNYAAGWTCDT